MSQIKKDYKDLSVAQILASRKISFKKLIKGIFFFNFGPTLVILVMMNSGFIIPQLALAIFGLIFLSSFLFLKPYIADIQELAEYVKNLAKNKNPKKPNLSFLNNVDELTDAIEKLNTSWIERSERLNALVEEDRKKQQLMKDFVANASHEMKTPLASINGFVETLLEQQNEPEAVKEFLNIIKDQGSRLAKLVDDMLTLSLAESGVSKDNFEVLNLVYILSDAERSLQTLINSRNINFIKETTSDSNCINGNKDEILRVFDNLISNAIKYSSVSTNVTVKIYQTNNIKHNFNEYDSSQKFICCEFIDEGEGISEENIQRLTERFFRVDKARSRKVGGTGLGLSIVRHMLNNHNAKLEIKSVIGKGSNFTIYFPVI